MARTTSKTPTDKQLHVLGTLLGTTAKITAGRAAFFNAPKNIGIQKLKPESVKQAEIKEIEAYDKKIPLLFVGNVTFITKEQTEAVGCAIHTTHVGYVHGCPLKHDKPPANFDKFDKVRFRPKRGFVNERTNTLVTHADVLFMQTRYNSKDEPVGVDARVIEKLA